MASDHTHPSPHRLARNLLSDPDPDPPHNDNEQDDEEMYRPDSATVSLCDDAGEEDEFEDFESLRSRSGFNEGVNRLYSVHAGRAYNNTSFVYRYPADQEEVLDNQHFVMMKSLPGLYRGPVEEVLNDRSRHRRLLDIGTGTGIWLLELAEMFPHVDCIGVDIVPFQHTTHLKNCTFMCVEAPDGLRVFASNSFDVIHIRQMLYATDDYPGIVAQAFRLLRKGGLLLMHEAQLQMYSQWEGFTAEQLAPATTRMLDVLRDAHAFRGARPELFHQMEQVLVEAGFEPEDIDTFYHHRQVCPDEPDSEYGQRQATNTLAFTWAARLMILESGLINEEEFDHLVSGIADEVHGESRGIAGPLCAQGVVSPWGYWWCLKRS